MKRHLVISLGLALALGCNNDETGTPDPTAPEPDNNGEVPAFSVLQTVPGADAVEVDPREGIVVTFSKDVEIDASTVNDTNLYLVDRTTKQKVLGTYDVAGNVVTFTPTQDLTRAWDYRGVVTDGIGVVGDGALSSGREWSFSTNLAVGVLDPSFGDDGEVEFHPAGGVDDLVVDVDVMSDDTMLITGLYTFNGRTASYLAMLDADGELDDTFGTEGVTVLSDGSAAVQLAGSEVLANGDIVMAGTLRPSSGDDVAFVARAEADGTLDKTFASGQGIVFLNSIDELDVVDLAVASDGRIYVLANEGGSAGVLVMAVAADGSGLEKAFDGGAVSITGKLGINLAGGLLVTGPGEGRPAGNDHVVVTAGVLEQRGSDFIWLSYLARHTPTGAFDDTFAGGDGFDFTEFNESTVPTTVALDDAGNLVVGAITAETEEVTNFQDFTPSVLRYSRSGRLDTGFGTNGATLLLDRAGQPTDIAVQADGKLLVAGYQQDPALATLARLRPTGALDATFAEDGVAKFGRNNDRARLYGVGVQSSHRIIGVGDLVPTNRTGASYVIGVW